MICKEVHVRHGHNIIYRRRRGTYAVQFFTLLAPGNKHSARAQPSHSTCTLLKHVSFSGIPGISLVRFKLMCHCTVYLHISASKQPEKLCTSCDTCKEWASSLLVVIRQPHTCMSVELKFIIFPKHDLNLWVYYAGHNIFIYTVCMYSNSWTNIIYHIYMHAGHCI